MTPKPQTGRVGQGLLVALLLLQPALAFAYIDPNSSGLLFQLLAPIFTGIVGAWLFLRRSISAFFRGLWRRITGKADQ